MRRLISSNCGKGQGVVEAAVRTAERRHHHLTRAQAPAACAATSASNNWKIAPIAPMPERQRGHREDREHRTPPQQPERVTEVLRPRVERGAGLHVADLFDHAIDPAEFEPRGAARRLRIEAAPLFLFHEQIEGGADFVIQFPLHAAAMKKVAEQGFQLLHLYPCRNAASGSTLDARQAGTAAASRPTANRHSDRSRRGSRDRSA